jgi:hypothetical protein
MLRSTLPTATTLKTIGKLVAASAIAGLLVFLTADAPKASADATGVQVQRAAKSERVKSERVKSERVKSERLPASVKGTACSARGWPHFEQNCLFDDRGSAADVRTVRVIALR